MLIFYLKIGLAESRAVEVVDTSLCYDFDNTKVVNTNISLCSSPIQSGISKQHHGALLEIRQEKTIYVYFPYYRYKWINCTTFLNIEIVILTCIENVDCSVGCEKN